MEELLALFRAYRPEPVAAALEKALAAALSAPLTWLISYTKARRRGSRNRLYNSAIRNSINSPPTRYPCSTTMPSF